MCAIATLDTAESVPKGGIREFLSLFFPLLGVSFSNYLFLFVEKLFLARVSPIAMEAAVSAMYVAQIFQGTSIAFAVMTQVFVARWMGAREGVLIGPGVWQFIWFSFLSMLITYPLGILYGEWYFHGAETAPLSLPYFYCMLRWNFLYPLGMVLISFYLGCGKTRLVLYTNLFVQGVKIGLGFVCIFGIDPWIPSFGIMGGAVSTLIAQGILCVVLLGVFLNRKHRDLFHSHAWQFRSELFVQCLRAGFSRAINRVLNFTSWAATAHLMVAKGGMHLLVLSTGGVVSLFLPFLFEAICQAQITRVASLLGARRFTFLYGAIKSGFYVVLCIVGLMAIPLVVYSATLYARLFPTMELDPQSIFVISFGNWLGFAFFTLTAIPVSYVLACKDLKFPIWMGFFNWINGFLLMYFFIEIIAISAEYFWCVLSFMHCSTFCIYLWRIRYLTLVKIPQLHYE